jgi:hypothetical protein
MSFSSEDPATVPMRRKRTVSERVTNNGDPLVVNKKAREAARVTSASSGEAPSKNTSKVCVHQAGVKVVDDRSKNTSKACVRQASVEVIDDEDDLRPRNPAPINSSHILELADGSEDDSDIDMPSLEEVDDSEDEDTEEDEGPAESAEAQLSGFS